MKIDVLDHGFVRLVESWGVGDAGYLPVDYECGIIEAARQLTQGSFRGWDQDRKLLAYLYKNNHSTPFEFAGMVLEVRAPIFVFREWHRHRTQSYNEMSARYAPLPDLNYIPTVERVTAKSANAMANKQAQGAATGIDGPVAQAWIEQLGRLYKDLEEMYQSGLAIGVPKELARVVLPVGRYSQMRASTCLRNWLAFLTLRLDPNAQWEIREYAKAVAKIVRQVFPETFALFNDVSGVEE